MDLSTKLRSAYIWTFAGNLTRQVLTFGLSLMTAHFLSPRDYGLAAVVSIFVAILSALQDAGVGQAIIYFGEEDLATLCTVSAASGLFFSALLFLSAGPIAAFYHAPALVAVVRWMSLSVLLGGLRSVSQAQVTKRLLFSKITLIESTGALLAAGLTVYLAAHGYGVWSIVVNSLLSNAIATTLMIAVAPPRFTWNPDWSLAKRFIKWSLPLTGSSLLWNFYDNADDLVVGRLANTQQLGFYTLAFRLATLINERVNAVIARVSYPAFAALRENREKVIHHWFAVTRTSALLSFPALTMLALSANDFVMVALGPKWLPAVPILRILSVVAFLRVLTPVIINLLPALGKPGLAFRYTLLNAVVMPISFAIGCATAGIHGVAIAWLLVFPFLASGLVRTALRLTGASATAYLANLRTPLCCAATVAAVMCPSLMLQSPGLARLITAGASGAIAFGAWLWIVFRVLPQAAPKQNTAPEPVRLAS